MNTLGDVLKEGLPLILFSLLVTVALGRLAVRLNKKAFRVIYVISWVTTIWFIIVVCVKAGQILWLIQ